MYDSGRVAVSVILVLELRISVGFLILFFEFYSSEIVVPCNRCFVVPDEIKRSTLSMVTRVKTES